MKEQIPLVVRCNTNGVTLEICHGDIPDFWRLLTFNPITEFELPDTIASDKDFSDWLGLYRRSNDGYTQLLLEESLCN